MEVNHGVTFVNSTNFPVPVSAAAAWNRTLWEHVGIAISTEVQGIVIGGHLVASEDVLHAGKSHIQRYELCHAKVLCATLEFISFRKWGKLTVPIMSCVIIVSVIYWYGTSY